jgi:HK97 family phage major capsid protein
MPTHKELEEDLHKRRIGLKELFDKNRNERGEYTHGGEDIAETRRRNDELNLKAEELERLVGEHKEAARLEELAGANEAALKGRGPRRPAFDGNGGGGDPGYSDAFSPGDQVNAFLRAGGMPAVKGLGDYLVEEKQFRAFKETKGQQYALIETPIHLRQALAVKTTLTSSGLTSFLRPPGIVLLGQQQPLVADLLAPGETNAPTVRYMREVSYTQAATAVAEGALKPEAAWNLGEVDAAVRKIAVTSKLTEEIIADFTAARDYVNARMPFMVATKLDSDLINGNGVAPNILGVLSVSGIQTQAQGTDPIPDCLYKAMVKIRSVGFFEPDAVVMNYLDWQNVRLLRTTDGLYIWGAPADPGPERVWGKPVVQTAFIAAKTAVVGAWQLGGQLFMRQGITTEMTNANEDDFKRNLIAIRTEVRAAAAWYRPLAFCSCTLT